MNLPLFKFYLYAKFSQNKVSDVSILQKKEQELEVNITSKQLLD
jgi:hypothetical protein